MSRLYPFRAWRYNPSAVRLQDVVTQPSDNISPAWQQAAYQRSPYNLIRLILGLPELFDAERGESVCTRAARDYRVWREQGVLLQEKDPCIFAYSQRFRAPDARGGFTPQPEKERRCFIALGKLHEYADQVVFRHEETPSKKDDRLALLTATGAQFDQILMLYSDPAGSVERILYDGCGPAEVAVTDDYGVLHRLWKISDPTAIRLLTAAMADKKLIIADGQDSYETALAHAKERPHVESTLTEHNPSDLPHPPYPEAAAMMTFVNMDSEGLVTLPTHRVIHGLAGFEPVSFAISAKEFFTVEALAEDSASGYLELLGRQPGTAFLAITRAGALLLRPIADSSAAALSGPPDRLRQLDVSQLHRIVLQRLLGLTGEAGCAETHVRFMRDAGEAAEQVRRGRADVAFLLKAVSIEQLKEVAFAGEVMPRKSIEFFPKLLSGLAIYSLEP